MISIVVCTFNREKYLDQCLHHLLNQNVNRSSFEVIVVNNKSTDNTQQIIDDFVKNNSGFPLKCFFEHKAGLSNARNTGIEKSMGEVIAFIDDDAFVRKDFVSNIQSFFINNQGVDGYGGKIEPLLECATPSWMSVWLMPLMSVLDMGKNVKVFKNNAYPIGANMGFTRRAALKTGDFNTLLGRTGYNLLGGEEKDYFFRMKKLRFKIVYLPEVCVQHIVPESRLKIEFIKKQAIGIGQSERLRIGNNGLHSKILFLLGFIAKWVGSLLLAIFYGVTYNWDKAKMLVKFRYWISKGFVSGCK